jgi:mannose-1-phosphate guanylyltransferase
VSSRPSACRNLVIVDTPDAVLVAHRDHLQRVKEVVGELKARGHDSYKLHKTVARPWGTYTVLEEGPGSRIKRIEVKPGAARSRSSFIIAAASTGSCCAAPRG